MIAPSKPTGVALVEEPIQPIHGSYFLTADPSGKLVSHPADGMPPERFFDGWGMTVMRSDWTEDATYAQFKIGDLTVNHTHYDVGSFYIYKH